MIPENIRQLAQAYSREARISREIDKGLRRLADDNDTHQLTGQQLTRALNKLNAARTRKANAETVTEGIYNATEEQPYPYGNPSGEQE